MAKQAYRIPTSLDSSRMDVEVSLSDNPQSPLKPIPIKILLAYLASACLCFVIISSTFVSAGSVIEKILFVILWGLLSWVLLKEDSTKRMQMNLVPVLLNYMPRGARRVMTRSNSAALPFLRILGISSIDRDTGLVSYTDGTYGFWYKVVGCASILLFDEDKDAILNRVDSYWQKQGTDYEIVFLTLKHAQKVGRQVDALQRRLDGLTIRDDDLDSLINEQFRALKYEVGESSRSVHQYMVLKGDNQEALLQARNVLQSEVENSNKMIKQCVAMYFEDITEVLKEVYRGGKYDVIG